MRFAFCALAFLMMTCAGLADDGPATSKPADTRPTSPIPAYVLSNGPDSYGLVAYLDCGPSRMANGEAGSLRQLKGEPFTWPAAAAVQASLGSVAFDPTEVIYEVAGLRPDDDYVLGFTWWDFDRNNRVQSVRFGTGEPVKWTTVLPSTPPVAWDADQPSWSEIFLPIPADYKKTGRFQVSFHAEGPPNAVVNELWLLRKPKQDAAKDRRRVVIVTGDDFPGHLWRRTAPELAAILRADPRLEVTITESPAILGSPLMAHYDAAVLHYMNWTGRPDPGEAVWKGLQQYVESGKGLVLVHFACGAFQAWRDFVKVAGRVFDPKLPPHDAYGPFEVKVSDREHPITKPMESFKTIDELYTCLTGGMPIRVLAEATSAVDRKDHPMGFVHQVGKGRVFHSTLGHDVNSFKAKGVRDLYRRATAWAAEISPE